MKAFKTPKYIEFFQNGRWHKRLNVTKEPARESESLAPVKVKRADEPKGEAPKRSTADLDWRDHP